MENHQQFKLYCSDITKSLDPNYNIKDKTKPLILEGVASTSDIDLEGDYITPQCIESFKLQATQCNIHNNHNVGLDDVIGTVLEVMDSDSQTLKIKFSILPLFRRHIEECIDNGVKLGLSIGGTILDYDATDDGLKIKNMMLHEISLTPLPANWNTMGTVTHETKAMDVIEAKCLNGICKQFLNNVKNEIKAKENMETEKRYYTKDEEAQFMSEDRVVELINEALNNFASNAVTEERVGEIIDEKLAQFVEKAKALEQAEIEKAKKAEKEEEEEEEEFPPEPNTEEKTEEEIEEEFDKKEKETKKSSIAELSPEEFGSLIAHAVQLSMEPPVPQIEEPAEPAIDLMKELTIFKEEIHNDIEKAVTASKTDIEKSLFDGLMKNSKPQTKAQDAQIKKFLKSKHERETAATNTLNVSDIAKTLAKHHQ